MTENQIFELGDFALQKGSVLPDAKLGYITLGELNAARDNVILCPTWFSGKPADVALAMTGEGRAIDPAKYFVVIPNHFGAGVSSSPSNTPAPFEKSRFPRVTTYDNVAAQHRLLTEGLGIQRIRLACSWSMGAAQSYHWAAAHPGMVDALAPINGSSKTADYNKVFIHSLIRAITSDPDYNDGFYTDKPPIKGIRTMASIYAGWGFSEPFYREQAYRALGARDVDQFIELFWDAFYYKNDPNDLLAQLWTWWNTDLGDHADFGGDFDAALAAITAETIIINADTDRYFPPVDAEYEASKIPNGRAQQIETIWGHMAPINPTDQVAIDELLRELLG